MKQMMLTILLVIGICLSNCSNDDFSCGNYMSLPYFNIQSIELLDHYRLEADVHELIPDSATVELMEYAGLNLQFGVDYIATHFQESSSGLDYFNFSLINKLVACTPFPDGGSGSKEEKMENIQIISLFDFDEDHLAGSSLNDIMTIQGFDHYSSQPKEKKIAEYLEQNTLIESERFLLKPTKAPAITDNFQVNVVVELSTGESYEMESALIKLE